MDHREQRVRERAYYIWEDEGRVSGRAEAHWFQAEAEFRAAGPVIVQATTEASLAPSPAKVLKPKAAKAPMAEPAQAAAPKVAASKVAAPKAEASKAAAPKNTAKASAPKAATAKTATAKAATAKAAPAKTVAAKAGKAEAAAIAKLTAAKTKSPAGARPAVH